MRNIKKVRLAHVLVGSECHHHFDDPPALFRAIGIGATARIGLGPSRVEFGYDVWVAERIDRIIAASVITADDQKRVHRMVL